MRRKMRSKLLTFVRVIEKLIYLKYYKIRKGKDE